MKNLNKILTGIVILLFINTSAAYEVKVVSPQSVPVNGTFTVEIIASGENISGADFKLLFNSDILNAEKLEEGEFFKNFGSTSLSPRNRITGGSILFASVLNKGAASGTGTAAVITFKAKSTGESALELSGTSPYPGILADAKGEPVEGVMITGGSVTVVSGTDNENQTTGTNGTAGNGTADTNGTKDNSGGVKKSSLNQVISENETGQELIEKPLYTPPDKPVDLEGNEKNETINVPVKNETLPVKNQTVHKPDEQETSEKISGSKPGQFNYLWLAAGIILIILIFAWLRSRN